MLNVNPEIICQIILKAREFQAKEGVTFVDSDFDDDAMQILATHKEDLTYQEARDAINDLEPDQQMTLVALMYVGRGDYDISEWESAFQEARDGWTTHTGEYLLSRPMVADYLEEGLAQLGHHCEDGESD